MDTKNLKQVVDFKASPHEVFEALMDPKKHAAFTGSKAVIVRKAGGAFSVCDGTLLGFTLLLKKDKRIVQAWRCEMEGWPDEHFSVLDLLIEPSKGGTKLTMFHYNVPKDCADSIDRGWNDYYWVPMKEFFGE